MTLRFVAYGVPRPQGSKRHVGRGILVESSNLAPWREQVAYAARLAMAGRARIDGPVSVEVTFYFDRPKSHHRTGRNSTELRPNAPRFPWSRAQGDLDKLLRGLGDAITGPVLADDSQITYISAAKRWTGDRVFGMDRPGCICIVREVER